LGVVRPTQNSKALTVSDAIVTAKLIIQYAGQAEVGSHRADKYDVKFFRRKKSAAPAMRLFVEIY